MKLGPVYCENLLTTITISNSIILVITEFDFSILIIIFSLYAPLSQY